MKRVVVVGCPGSGKTTFSKKLATKTKLPVIHLDYYYHQSGRNYGDNREAWVAQVRSLASQESWIMDGNYNSTVAERFDKADTIIFLDYPRRTSLYGILKRRLLFHKKTRQDMPDNWKEKANLALFSSVLNFKRTKRPTILKILKSNRNKDIITFKNRKQAAEYLASTT